MDARPQKRAEKARQGIAARSRGLEGSCSCCPPSRSAEPSGPTERGAKVKQRLNHAVTTVSNRGNRLIVNRKLQAGSCPSESPTQARTEPHVRCLRLSGTLPSGTAPWALPVPQASLLSRPSAQARASDPIPHSRKGTRIERHSPSGPRCLGSTHSSLVAGLGATSQLKLVTLPNRTTETHQEIAGQPACRTQGQAAPEPRRQQHRQPHPDQLAIHKHLTIDAERVDHGAQRKQLMDEGSRSAATRWPP